ncbi:hypothetical protein Dip510_000011 [Elusimicrobium posterum]|uniref:hypothetical protein n=1 Tax=Elusimicrobium posterum TaxID=3116653 RepID=UPI003C73C2D3
MKKLNIAVLTAVVLIAGAVFGNAQMFGRGESYKIEHDPMYKLGTGLAGKNTASKAEKKEFSLNQAAKAGEVKEIKNVRIIKGTDVNLFVEAYKLAADKETQEAIYDKLVDQIIENAPSFGYAVAGEWFDGKIINGKKHASWTTIKSAAKDEASRLLTGIKKVASKAQIRKQQEEERAAAKGEGTKKAKSVMSEEVRAWETMMLHM